MSKEKVYKLLTSCNETNVKLGLILDQTQFDGSVLDQIENEYKELCQLSDITIKQLLLMDTINVSNRAIQVLPKIPSWVIKLDCNVNKLTALPELTNLTHLNCSENYLTTIPNLPNVLHLLCGTNELVKLGELPRVKTLACSHNKLTNLPKLDTVECLTCLSNKLTTLPQLPNVKWLYCSNNQLNILPQLPNAIKVICDDYLNRSIK